MEPNDFQTEETRFISNTTASVKPADSDQSESRTIEGMAFRYNEWSVPMRGLLNGKPIVFRERILPGAADNADMSDVIARAEHSNHSILARSKNGKGTLHLELTDDGLFYRFDSPNTTAGNDTLENLRLGNVDASSFEFKIRSKGATLRKGTDGIWERDISGLKKIKDVAVVAEPAYPTTTAFARSQDFANELNEEEQEETSGARFDEYTARFIINKNSI